tara:strand:- start:1529 stop:1897 length:369 start_codon:yes stop_codon:yes gene_type:complete
MVRSRENLIAAYAFLIGVILAIIFGLLTKSPEEAGGLFYSILVLIGITVGLAKSGDEGSSTFLLASLALIIVGALGMDPLIYIAQNNYVVNSLRNILTSLLVLFIPVTIIVSLKTVFSMARI